MKKHPWARFLNARYEVILWMKNEKNYSNEEIAENLSMDAKQVYLIIANPLMPIPEPDYEEIDIYPSCKECGAIHGMGVENMETHEIKFIELCEKCLWKNEK